MDRIQQVAYHLSYLSVTDRRVTQNDSNTELERHHRNICVFEGRAYEMDLGLVRQRGGISK